MSIVNGRHNGVGRVGRDWIISGKLLVFSINEGRNLILRHVQ